MWTAIRRFFRDKCGAAAVEAAFIIPLVGAVTMGSFETVLLMSDMHRANEGARGAAREAVIGPLLATMDTSGDGSYVVTCTGDGTDDDPFFTCTGDNTATLADPSDIYFGPIYDAAAGIMREIDPSDLSIIYRSNDILISGAPDVVTPSVTVIIANRQYTFLLLSAFPGIPNTINMPDATATRMSPSYVQ